MFPATGYTSCFTSFILFSSASNPVVPPPLPAVSEHIHCWLRERNAGNFYQNQSEWEKRCFPLKKRKQVGLLFFFSSENPVAAATATYSGKILNVCFTSPPFPPPPRLLSPPPHYLSHAKLVALRSLNPSRSCCRSSASFSKVLGGLWVSASRTVNQ